jgi:hypothetical protein
MKKERIPPHPLAPGEENVLFTSLPPAIVMIVNSTPD